MLGSQWAAALVSKRIHFLTLGRSRGIEQKDRQFFNNQACIKRLLYAGPRKVQEGEADGRRASGVDSTELHSHPAPWLLSSSCFLLLCEIRMTVTSYTS